MKTSRTHISSIVATAILTALLPGIANAWSAEGHEAVAWIADAKLKPTARAAVQRLLALEPGATLASVSTWADQTRNRNTARWHYINFPRGDCHYVEDRCPDGQCVVAAINRENAVLHSSAGDQEKLIALKYLVHFVGDVHQPLHAGYADDKGGNTYQVNTLGRGGNLHGLWDFDLPRSIAQNSYELAQKSMKTPLSAAQLGTAASWAEESCAIVSTPGFYPPHKVPDEDYYHRYAPVAQAQLLKAGLRLAALLNDLR